MEIEKIKKIISGDQNRRETIIKYKKYYDNENDILAKGIVPIEADPLRTADNRVPHNFHEIMVDEKTGYMFTYPVLFDVGNDAANKKIKSVLGDKFEYETQGLCIEASNAGKTWLHYWITKSNEFRYSNIPDEQIIPIYDNTLEKELKKVYRYYQIFEKEEGKSKVSAFVYFEEWDLESKTFDTYKFKGALNTTSLKLVEGFPEHITFEFEKLPFIEFSNNHKGKSDLLKYKKQIDLYDRVLSGFANDLEDIQQVIYILENYGGENLQEFVKDLKRFKAIKTDASQTGTHGDVRTLQIDIPVEARKVLLEILKKQIYESGQALQQDTEDFGNASGVALKFFYRKLELKAGMMETQFRKGFAELIRAIAKYHNLKIKDDNIEQTWTRNMISNDYENAQIAQMSTGVISQKTILKNHPWVQDADIEKEQLEKEQEIYSFPNKDDKNNKDEKDDKDAKVGE